MRGKVLLILFVISITALTDAQPQKVLLENVKTLTLKKGQMTTGRRNAPVKQLVCVGGSAKDQYVPHTVQCTQTGHDGLDFQWKCTADMPQQLEFGEIAVNCEGYDYPEDKYILAGSCSLEYKLENRADNYAEKDYKLRKSKGQTSFFEDVIPLVVLAFICFVVFLTCKGIFSSHQNGSDRTQRRRNGSSGNGPDDDFGRRPGYPPGDDCPPKYDDLFGKQRSQYSQNQNSQSGSRGSNAEGDGPGFWTGVGLGAAAGYLYRSRNQQTRPSTSTRDTSTSFASDSFSNTSTLMETESSTAYGGTRRR